MHQRQTATRRRYQPPARAPLLHRWPMPPARAVVPALHNLIGRPRGAQNLLPPFLDGTRGRCWLPPPLRLSGRQGSDDQQVGVGRCRSARAREKAAARHGRRSQQGGRSLCESVQLAQPRSAAPSSRARMRTRAGHARWRARGQRPVHRVAQQGEHHRRGPVAPSRPRLGRDRVVTDSATSPSGAGPSALVRRDGSARLAVTATPSGRWAALEVCVTARSLLAKLGVGQACRQDASC